MGSDPSDLADLRAGKHPFQPYEEAVRYGARCQIIGLYPDALDPEALGVAKHEARFMGRASLMALKAARIAIDQSGLDPTPLAIAIGSGTGDVDTHIEIAEKLRTTGSMRRVSATVIPKLMASTVSANLVNVLRTTGPSFAASAACAGGNYNIAIAAGWIESGIVDGDRRRTSQDRISSPVRFDARYNGQDNASRTRFAPYARDRSGFVFSRARAFGPRIRESAEKRRFGPGSPRLRHDLGRRGEMVAPRPTGGAMRRALTDAGVSPTISTT
jgi:3-oxoacyl-(acyl-carrier-protein) synthase